MKNDLHKLSTHDVLVLALIALVLYPVAYLYTGSWMVAGLLACLGAAGIYAMRQRYFQTLTNRINQNKSVEWTVEINDVKVGSISDADYAAVRLQVFSDLRIYRAQAANVGRVVLRTFDYCYVAIPMALFWIMVMLAVIEPEMFANVVTRLQQDGAAAVAAAGSNAVEIIGSLMLVVIGLHLFFGTARFGFINRFSEATDNIVRKRCGVPAEGDLVLVRWEHGAQLFNDELAGIKRAMNEKFGKKGG